MTQKDIEHEYRKLAVKSDCQCARCGSPIDGGTLCWDCITAIEQRQPHIMSDDEILLSYKSAENKQYQIQILADLNICSHRAIAECLARLGVDDQYVTRCRETGLSYRRGAQSVDSMRCDELAPALYEKGMSDAQIAEALGARRGLVEWWRHRHGLPAVSRVRQNRGE